MQEAPFYADAAQVPSGGGAYWIETSDGLQLRVGVWLKGHRGTVLCFPGRSECIERYGHNITELVRRGYSVAVIDWRGQGLSGPAPGKGPRIGHVGSFAEYQLDVKAYFHFATDTNLPKPFFMMAHSMGGTIGLRALIENLKVKAAVFIAPMWDIALPSFGVKPLLYAFGSVAEHLGWDHHSLPTFREAPYVQRQSFKDNVLTSDPDMWSYIERLSSLHPDLDLGSPSIGWLKQALRECADLKKYSSPPYPVMAALGSAETLVKQEAVKHRILHWPGACLDIYEGARHSLTIEKPKYRLSLFDKVDAFLSGRA